MYPKNVHNFFLGFLLTPRKPNTNALYYAIIRTRLL